jgi:hypothetical protein
MRASILKCRDVAVGCTKQNQRLIQDTARKKCTVKFICERGHLPAVP